MKPDLFLHDLRVALRSLARAKGLTITVALTLALGTTVLFALAVVTYLTAMRRATATAELTSVRHRKLAAYLSLICWCGVAISERAAAGLP